MVPCPPPPPPGRFLRQAFRSCPRKRPSGYPSIPGSSVLQFEPISTSVFSCGRIDTFMGLVWIAGPAPLLHFEKCGPAMLGFPDHLQLFVTFVLFCSNHRSPVWELRVGFTRAHANCFGSRAWRRTRRK